MSSLVRVLTVLAALLVIASPAMAQPVTNLSGAEHQAVAKASNPYIGPGLGIGLSVVGIGIGLGLIGFAALSGAARQPEQVGVLRGLMILLAALVEGAGVIGILFSLAMLFV